MPISKINTSSITDNSVTAGKIVAGAVDADIAAGSIDTAQIADDAVTADKLATLTGDVSHGDNVKAKFGTGNDLNIYHDGSDSYIKDDGTGSLWVASNEFRVANAGVTENMIIATENAAVKLYHNNALKLETTATGVAVTGGVALGGTGAANTLDDYEEGTWTPVLKLGGNNVGMVFTGQGGFYTKVGNLVTVNSYYSLSDKGSSNGAAQIHGLPFAVANVTNNYIPVSLGFSGVSFADMMIGYCQPNQAYVNLREVSNAGSHTTIVQSNVANSGDMMMSVTYRTA